MWKVNAAVEEGRMDLVWDFADEYTDEALRLMTTSSRPAAASRTAASVPEPAPTPAVTARRRWFRWRRVSGRPRASTG